MTEQEGSFHIKKGKPLPLGVSKVENGVQFAISLPYEKECKLNLYDKTDGRKVVLTISEEYKIGSVFSVILEDIPFDSYEYNYEGKNGVFTDPYANSIRGREKWGEISQKAIRCGISFDEYEWKEKKPLGLSHSDLILYQLHVRGFTKHSSSKVKHRGTFLGLQEKIPYLKELGVNGILLMPCYEFNEILQPENGHGMDWKFVDQEKQETKINYWGYAKECNYFAPKASFAADTSNPIREMRNLIQELHENQIELYMELCFRPETNKMLILDCLRHWVLQYHVDGFKINDDVVPSSIVATDPVLARIKLFATSWRINEIYEDKFTPEHKSLGEFNDGFLVDSRKYLKSDEGQVDKFLSRMKRNHNKFAVINYITNINGFSLMDLVSYDVKHNEANGEKGRDGTEFNFSWNCGFEGKTRKKAILSLRKKQIKNAFLMLLFSQGTPMLVSGDEFGNSNMGNNNPYCQDNEISWLNWNLLHTNQDIFDYVKLLLQLRKEHKIFHMDEEFRNMDYISCGSPDLSVHGTKAWYPDFSNYSRTLGVMLCGKYAVMSRTKKDDYFYIAYNMHWEPHEFDLPKLPDRMEWSIFIDSMHEFLLSETGQPESLKLTNQKSFVVMPRTIIVFIGK